MNSIDNLIGAARILSDIQEEHPHRQTLPTGLIDADTSPALPIIVDLFNQCRKDKAMLANSNAIATLYEIAVGECFTTEAYWQHAEAFGQILESLENLLTPLPITPSEVKAKLDDFTSLLKDYEIKAKAVMETLLKMKAECDLLGTASEKMTGGSHGSTYCTN